MFKKLAKQGNFRVYKLDVTLYNGVDGRSIDQPTNLVIVSDAHTHIERMVFPAYIKPNYTEQDVVDGTDKCLGVDYMRIAGEMTMMIEGGDPSTVRPDEEYLLELIEANKEVLA